ncbi:MAG: hypothetical protein ACLRZ6_06490 [Lachnospiraceae bacterium]
MIPLLSVCAAKDAIKMRLSRLLEGNIADYGIYCACLGDKSELDKEQKELLKIRE